MADSVPMLQREQRRHLLMNGWLIAGFIVVGTAVTNERGIFRPLGLDSAMSASARAFLAVASPAGLDPDRMRDVRSVSSTSPFDVTAPDRDLRRRLIDAIDWVPGEGENPTDPNAQPLSVGQSPLSADASQINPSDLPAAFSTPPDQLGVQNPNVPTADFTPATPVPEPATWAMLIVGFGLIGGMLRAVEQRRRQMPLVRRRKGQAPVAA